MSTSATARTFGAMTLRAPAKLNLRLRVLGPRPDGFHDVETHLVRLRLADTVFLEPGAPGITLQLDRAGGTAGAAGVPADRRNLCWKAAEIFYEAVGREPSVAIRLTKRIPVAAGLGGGSSDAAAVLAGLNEAHGAPMSATRLLACASALGSDVPFFAARTTAGVATGRGEQIRPVEAPPARPVLIVVPDFGIAAAEAYGWWREDAPGPSSRHERPASPPAPDGPDAPADWPSISRRAVNDLAAPVVARHAVLGAALEGLRAARAAPAILCGSGACVAGVFETEDERDAARARLSESRTIDPAWKLVSTSTEGPRGV